MARKLKKKYRVILPAAAAALVLLLAAVFLFTSVIPGCQYRQAAELMAEEKYEEAGEIFSSLGSYKDSEQLKEECEKGTVYLQAVADMKAGSYESAAEKFSTVSGFKDSAQLMEACRAAVQEEAYDQLIAEKKYGEAFVLLQTLQKTADAEKQKEIDGKLNQLAAEFFNAGDQDNALAALDAISDQNTADPEIRQKIADQKKAAEEAAEAAARAEESGRELAEMIITDEQSAARAKELISVLPESEDLTQLAQLIDGIRPYLGTYYSADGSRAASIEITNDGAVIIDGGTICVLQYPLLTGRAYTNESSYREYTVYDTNTITVIGMENGAAVSYDSYTR